MEYPENHKKIVEDLMGGRFILSRELHFENLQKEEEFYGKFFTVSFDYELRLTKEYAYLISDDTDEHLSRDISIFFAIFCYEMDKAGKNFLEGLQYSEYSMEDINQLFDNSSYSDLIASNKQLKDAESRRKFLLNTMGKRNIIEKVSEDKFYFTPAHKVFIEYAQELGQSKLSNGQPDQAVAQD